MSTDPRIFVGTSVGIMIASKTAKYFSYAAKAYKLTNFDPETVFSESF
jgi:hypothetical protein